MKRPPFIIAGLNIKEGAARVLSSPESTLLGSFAGAIILGAIVLLLPWSHRVEQMSFVDALFTATSAVCVTGLTVLDTGKDFTLFGQTVILALIQIGGLGIMTLAALAFILAGRRLPLRSQALVSESFFQQDFATEFRSTFRTILTITFVMEGVGASLLFLLFLGRMEAPYAAFAAVFHSISAFCNAGFSVFSSNLVEVRESTASILIMIILIVSGGLGYMVLHEIWTNARAVMKAQSFSAVPRFSFHARVVLIVTALLLFWGGVALLSGGLGEELDWSEKMLHALFQSVTARTAGFNTVDIGRLPSASMFILIMLMFVGGSPASCAGGVKTTGFAIWLARLNASVRGRREVRLLDRQIPEDVLNRVDFLLALAVFWNVIGILVMLSTQTHLRASALELIFEQISAFGTVGLSTGLTPDLSPTGKLWICATMFVGRTGPLTVALWMFSRDITRISYPKGRVMIG
jgi:trk system potassium uptake protein TrkH